MASGKGYSGFGKKGRSTPVRHNTGRDGEKRYLMLSKDKMDIFKYKLQDLCTKYKIDEKIATPFIANIIAKASRNSIFEAKDYIQEKEKEGMIQADISHEIFNLLDRYSRMR